MAKNTSKAGDLQVKKRHPNKGTFKPNDPATGEKDPRINRKGRIIPKDIKELNTVIDELFAEEIADASGNKMDKLRIALNRLLLNKNPSGPIHILDRRYGKVKEQVDITNSDGTLTPPPLPDEERFARMKQLAAAIAQELKKDA